MAASEELLKTGLPNFIECLNGMGLTMWFWWIILMGLFSIVARRAYRFTRLVRLIKQTPVCAIRELQTGFGIVEGNVIALDRLLEAPLTGEPCVAFGVTVAVPGEDADIARSSQIIAFALDDGTGHIELDSAGYVWTGTDTLQHDRDATPSPKLLERVRLLFPYIEERSADGDLATSGMMCRETIVREGTSMCAGGYVVVTPGTKAQFTRKAGDLKVITSPSRHELLQQMQSSALSYWVTAVALVGLAVVGHVLQLYQYPIAWLVGAFAVGLFAFLLSDRVSV